MQGEPAWRTVGPALNVCARVPRGRQWRRMTDETREEKGIDKMEIIRVGAEWKEEILKFADQVFGEDVQPGGFAALIPDVYGDTAPCDQNHWLVLEDGRIQALLLMEPITYVCGREELRGVGVGTVSVAEEARGKGYMQLLLGKVQEEMSREGYAFAVLSGQRQRYGYWGYEPAGLAFWGQIRPANIKHALKDAYTAGLEKEITFAPLKEGGEEEKKAFVLFQKGCPHTFRREERFVLHLKAGRAKSFAVHRNGMFAGYLNVSSRRGEPAVTELELTDRKLLPAVLKAFFLDQAREGFSIRLPLYQKQQLAVVEEICDWYTLESDHQYRIADMGKMLEFFMKAKQSACGLTDGSWAFRTQERLYRCQVKQGCVKVTEQEREAVSKEEWERTFTASYSRLVRLLFGPLTVLAGPLPEAPEGWFPLPLYLPDADAV